MKMVIQRRLLLASSIILVVMFSSFTRDKAGISPAFSKLVESEALRTEGVDQGMIDRFYALAASGKLQTTNEISCTWRAVGTQYPFPYRGNHLQVVLENVTTSIDTDNDASGAYTPLYFNNSSAELRLVCSSYYEWEIGGYLHLWVRINNVVVFDEYKYNPSGWGTAPALGLFNEPFTVYPYDHVDIALEVVDNMP